MFDEQAADDLNGLERRLPIGWVLAGVLIAGNVAATISMLLAQA